MQLFVRSVRKDFVLKEVLKPILYTLLNLIASLICTNYP